MLRALFLCVATAGVVCAQTFDDARRLHEQGRLAEAERAYRAVLKKGGPTPEVLANLGAVLARMDRFDDAVRVYQQALRLAPNLTPILLNLGLAYFKASRFDKAFETFGKFLESEPDHRQARQLRAMSALELERYDDAIADYQLLLPSEDLGIRLGLATAYTRSGKTDSAREALGPAVSNEESADVQFLLGQAYAEEGKLEEALAAFEKALKLNPSLPQIRLNIGAVHWKRKHADLAMEAWRAEYAANPSTFAANYTLGAALALSAEHREEAEKYLRVALALKPTHAGTLFHLGKLVWQKSKSPEAQGLLERAVKADGESREARYLLATVYQSLGRRVEAAREFAAVKKLSEKELKRSRDLFEAER